MRSASIVRPDAGPVSLLLALLFLASTLALETVVAVPMKLPGHRALPGALTLLVLAEVFIPLFLVAVAGAVPALLAALGYNDPQMVLAWLLVAVLLAAAGRRRWRDTLWWFLAIGLLFGLARYLLLLPGLHRTPDVLRLGGHLVFGGLGGLLARWIARVGRRPTV